MIKILPITEKDKEYFQQFYSKHNIIGLLEEPEITRIIVKMKQGYKGFTPIGCARDCGDHYIIERYSSYDRVDKKTLGIIKDVEDR